MVRFDRDEAESAMMFVLIVVMVTVAMTIAVYLLTGYWQQP